MSDKVPQRFYAIRWVSRRDPKYHGLLWASGTLCQPGWPWAEMDQVEQEAASILVEQEIEILSWSLDPPGRRDCGMCLHGKEDLTCKLPSDVTAHCHAKSGLCWEPRED